MAAGDAVVSPGLTRKPIDAFANRLPGRTQRQQRQLDDLTERERQVLVAMRPAWATPRSPPVHPVASSTAVEVRALPEHP
ncbi:hypothetical protein ACFY1L_02190 [Streptomyces sp. NPDC001663]|uniref:hypothetical protein n=1 Tax=Streptomyces sp. NPDC001663 TaxID=3364597 RepID=UPI00369FDF06